jgi:hypothetical protein
MLDRLASVEGWGPLWTVRGYFLSSGAGTDKIFDLLEFSYTISKVEIRNTLDMLALETVRSGGGD